MEVHVTYRGDGAGSVQVWLEKFGNTGCGDASGDAGTFDGGEQSVASGQGEATVTIPSVKPDSPYVGVGARLWNADSSQALAEKTNYAVCYKVNP